jgi:short-subunit dehydrogenase
MSEWRGKTVWVTGASSGIGRALAVKLADLGCTVVISARRLDVLEEVAQHSPRYLLPLAVDISNANMRESIRKQLAERVESIDIAIFSAGIVEYEDNLDFIDDRYQRVFAANFFGLVNSVAIAMPLLKKSRYKPYIVGLSSLSMVLGFPRAEAYGSSKAAADYFLKSLRADLSPDKFDITIVRPGFVTTPMTSVNDFPMPFVISADEAADRILYGMKKRKLIFSFPSRFSLLLRLLSAVPWLWYKKIAPKMNRHKRKQAQLARKGI